MIKITLVNITEDMECPPLTLAYLATYLKEHLKKNVAVKIVDINFDNPLKKILQLKPDIVGISSMTVKYNFARKFAREIKKHMKVPVILGGVHISTMPQSFSKFFDIGIVGEGEKTILELAMLFKKGHSFPIEELEKIRGIIFWKDGKIIKTGLRELTTNLDEFPIPNRKLLDKRYFTPKVSYNKLRGEKVIEAGMLTSRGCPYRCVFCSTSLFWNRVRFHSPIRVAKEIGYLAKEFGVNYIVMYDDFFAISVERAKNIYEAMKKRNLVGEIKISCSLRANVVTEELCKILKKIGVATVNFGFESGSNRILQYLKAESVTVEQNKNAVSLCRKYGFNVTGSFMLGSPSETIEDMKKTLELMEWIKKQGAIDLWCGVTKPYPGTKLWEYGIKNNLINKNFNWDSIDPSYIHNPIFLDKGINRKEFFKIFKKAKYKSFEINSMNKENKVIRKLKDFVYYNKILYDSTRFLTEKIPQGIKNLLRAK